MTTLPLQSDEEKEPPRRDRTAVIGLLVGLLLL